MHQIHGAGGLVGFLAGVGYGLNKGYDHWQQHCQTVGHVMTNACSSQFNSIAPGAIEYGSAGAVFGALAAHGIKELAERRGSE
ncbi:MAG TPA: hypothetical protein VFV91_10365 [Gaiellaceae bacterium]|nr:hypothetical protein [Gaiellaceae bacterium]